MTVTVNDIPPTVRIGPHDVRFSPLSKEDAETDYANWVESELTIGLRAEYVSGTVAVDSIIHELMHAIWFVGSLRETDTEEQFCTVYATILTQIIRDNPGLIEWMQQTVKK